MSPSQLRAAAFAYENQEDPRFEAGDRWAAREQSLRQDTVRMADLDERASEELDGDTYRQLFAAMADFQESRLLQRLAEGDSMRDMFPGQLDVFARLAHLSEQLAAERRRRIDDALDGGGAE